MKEGNQCEVMTGGLRFRTGYASFTGTPGGLAWIRVYGPGNTEILNYAATEPRRQRQSPLNPYLKQLEIVLPRKLRRIGYRTNEVQEEIEHTRKAIPEIRAAVETARLVA